MLAYVGHVSFSVYVTFFVPLPVVFFLESHPVLSPDDRTHQKSFER